MNTYNIREAFSGHFCTIEARTAASALRKAANTHPRRASDYNVDPGEPGGTVTWYAENQYDETDRGQASVNYPGRGSKKIEIL